MNPLTQKARFCARREAIENCLIVAIGGITIGVLCALFIK